jgi:hypothetical protein
VGRALAIGGSFPSNDVEILWVEDAEARRRSGLGAQNGGRPVRHTRFGVVLREMVGEPDRERYEPYQVPSGGPALLLLGSALDDRGNPSWRFGRTGARLGARISGYPCSTRAALVVSTARCCQARLSQTLVRSPCAMFASSLGGCGCGWSGTGRRPRRSFSATRDLCSRRRSPCSPPVTPL